LLEGGGIGHEADWIFWFTTQRPDTGVSGRGKIDQDSTLPPAASQASAVLVMVKPWPLQEFSPLHSLLAVLQALMPLQELLPVHLTASSANALDTGASAKKPAAAVATAIPENFLAVVMCDCS
jgi:hypothetical protein